VFYRFVRRVFLILSAPLFRFQVRGRQHVPETGPAIVVAPHRSWLDPACVGAACPRPVRFLILWNVYKKPWARWFYHAMGTLPVGAGGYSAISSVREALRALRRGEVVGVFPEGRVSTPERPAPIHPGAAMLASHTGAPIVPMQITGSSRAWPHGKRLPSPAPVSVVIEAPIPTREAGRRRSRDEVAREIEQLLSTSASTLVERG
jgi:1-acyl-sn-glycerol-3-phosphate acyltransferase